ncbi:MAG: hypothetical protein JWO59_729 [Chloroflexi bacterium]|nr:hypothetical protein [Chloroflexota bacterium]
MPQPTLSDVHVNRPLTNLSIAYLQDPANFVARRVFPVVEVLSKSDVYFKYLKDEWFRDDVQERAPSTESSGNGYNVDATGTYNCRVYSHHKDVDDQIRANSDSVLSPDRDATLFVTAKHLLHAENIFNKKYFQAGVWGNADQTGVASAPGTNQFLRWDQAGSTPILDVKKQALQIASQTGLMPNVLVLGPNTELGLTQNADIIDRVKYVQKGFLDLAALAEAFGVDEVVAPKSVINTNPEVAKGTVAPGTATDTSSSFNGQFIYGKGAMLVHRAKAPGLMTPSAGYIFGWKGFLGNSSWVRVKRYRMEHLGSDRVEGDAAYDMQLTGLDLGVYFAQAVS